MKVKNISTRLHHVGNVSIGPGEEKEIPEAFKKSINTKELIEIVEEIKKDIAPVPKKKTEPVLATPTFFAQTATETAAE